MRITPRFLCDQTWDAMTPTERGRHCGACEREVIDLVRLTRREARRAIAAAGPSPCLRVAVDARHHAVFRPEPRSLASMVAGVGLVGALSACEAPPSGAIESEPAALDASLEDAESAWVAASPPPMLPVEREAAARSINVGPAVEAPLPEPIESSEPIPTAEQIALTRAKHSRRRAARHASGPVAPTSYPHVWMGDMF